MGTCEWCKRERCKYTCPRCERKYCCSEVYRKSHETCRTERRDSDHDRIKTVGKTHDKSRNRNREKSREHDRRRERSHHISREKSKDRNDPRSRDRKERDSYDNKKSKSHSDKDSKENNKLDSKSSDKTESKYYDKKESRYEENRDKRKKEIEKMSLKRTHSDDNINDKFRKSDNYSDKYEKSRYERKSSPKHKSSESQSDNSSSLSRSRSTENSQHEKTYKYSDLKDSDSKNKKRSEKIRENTLIIPENRINYIKKESPNSKNKFKSGIDNRSSSMSIDEGTSDDKYKNSELNDISIEESRGKRIKLENGRSLTKLDDEKTGNTKNYSKRKERKYSGNIENHSDRRTDSSNHSLRTSHSEDIEYEKKAKISEDNRNITKHSDIKKDIDDDTERESGEVTDDAEEIDSIPKVMKPRYLRFLAHSKSLTRMLSFGHLQRQLRAVLEASNPQEEIVRRMGDSDFCDFVDAVYEALGISSLDAPVK